jgi:hypothetical protein
MPTITSTKKPRNCPMHNLALLQKAVISLKTGNPTLLIQRAHNHTGTLLPTGHTHTYTQTQQLPKAVMPKL